MVGARNHRRGGGERLEEEEEIAKELRLTGEDHLRWGSSLETSSLSSPPCSSSPPFSCSVGRARVNERAREGEGVGGGEREQMR